MCEKKKPLRAKFLSALQFAKNPAADRRNPHFGSRYASLAAITNEIRRAELTNEVGYAFRYKDGILTSYIFDGDETEDLSALPVAIDTNPQITGSRMTYAKRQLAQIDWALCADDDDDGNAAAGGDNTGAAEAETKAGKAPEETAGIELVCKTCGRRFRFHTRAAAIDWFQRTHGAHDTAAGDHCSAPKIESC